MGIRRVIIVMAAVGCSLTSSVWVRGQQTREEQMKAYLDVMRKDVRAERQNIVDAAMGLEAGDKAKFWTVYEKYQAEMKGLVDQRLANIRKYAENYRNMTDAVADEIAAKAMDIDAQRAAIRKKYYGQMKSALGARGAGRFLQTEIILDDLLELQVGSQIPLIP